MDNKPCERCELEALPKERFCKACKIVVLAEMKKSGFLQVRQYSSSFRSAEKKEAVHETKHGIDR